MTCTKCNLNPTFQRLNGYNECPSCGSTGTTLILPANISLDARHNTMDEDRNMQTGLEIH
ncbi:hypothetical protein RhiJN_11548 [Ceratobasidium sp. AG-Ba]|nr:hypothetical protein RhiJN_11548 [Ceratobasidium sp. AG-Ba]